MKRARSKVEPIAELGHLKSKLGVGVEDRATGVATAVDLRARPERNLWED